MEAIGIHLSPTYQYDDIKSATLKSFRKVVGYDTFNSILKGERDEKKDPADFYNVTVSMMVKRNPHPSKVVVHTPDVFDGNKSLGQVLDKGFPYDDGDNVDILNKIKGQAKKKTDSIVGKLNGENISKTSLKNLVQDKTSPITEQLVKLA